MTQVSKELMRRIEQQLENEIKAGTIELEQHGQQIIIRIREQGSFPEGSAFCSHSSGLLFSRLPGR